MPVAVHQPRRGGNGDKPFKISLSAFDSAHPGPHNLRGVEYPLPRRSASRIMIRDDYILRLIDQITAALAKVLFNKKIEHVEEVEADLAAASQTWVDSLQHTRCSGT